MIFFPGEGGGGRVAEKNMRQRRRRVDTQKTQNANTQAPPRVFQCHLILFNFPTGLSDTPVPSSPQPTHHLPFHVCHFPLSVVPLPSLSLFPAQEERSSPPPPLPHTTHAPIPIHHFALSTPPSLSLSLSLSLPGERRNGLLHPQKKKKQQKAFIPLVLVTPSIISQCLHVSLSSSAGQVQKPHHQTFRRRRAHSVSICRKAQGSGKVGVEVEEAVG